ncbi:clathrin coat assembly protein AP180 isoform X1 [Salmo trutta]|uniref:Clathrin coat assembly protein AP180 n=1 Tax=Salmo trutta TaxID=8032 RepID=A0A674E301_SALTR|nr:clathrin coat assembly protein AP180-like isoform X1 [Salmo trutta]XP_029593960.1 clathrin coat assembly protein AP180-like isoform X1 [Salmo trutta]XP_029593962.1 clathrin coat assembly protein AP180-like isoform X1 [Salmo trutta]
MSGQTLTDRIAAAQYSLTGSEVARAVCKATTHEQTAPKKKHLEYLIEATKESNVNIPQMADTLFERATNASWVVVFKALITTHHMMVAGNERFLQFLASRNTLFNLSNFLDKTGSHGYDMSTFIRRYSRYLNEKAFAYRQMSFDFGRVKKGAEGVMRTMPVEKLLKGMPTLQSQIDALLEFDVHPNELTNGVINACFLLMFKDLIKLYACYNDGIINVLEKFFQMKRGQCKDGLEIYKRFLTRMTRVSEVFKIAETIGIDKNDIPELTQAPESLLQSLETHLNTLEGKKPEDVHREDASPTKECEENGSPAAAATPTKAPAAPAAATAPVAPARPGPPARPTAAPTFKSSNNALLDLDPLSASPSAGGAAASISSWGDLLGGGLDTPADPTSTSEPAAVAADAAAAPAATPTVAHTDGPAAPSVAPTVVLPVPATTTSDMDLFGDAFAPSPGDGPPSRAPAADACAGSDPFAPSEGSANMAPEMDLFAMKFDNTLADPEAASPTSSAVPIIVAPIEPPAATPVPSTTASTESAAAPAPAIPTLDLFGDSMFDSIPEKSPTAEKADAAVTPSVDLFGTDLPTISRGPSPLPPEANADEDLLSGVTDAFSAMAPAPAVAPAQEPDPDPAPAPATVSPPKPEPCAPAPVIDLLDTFSSPTLLDATPAAPGGPEEDLLGGLMSPSLTPTAAPAPLAPTLAPALAPTLAPVSAQNDLLEGGFDTLGSLPPLIPATPAAADTVPATAAPSGGFDASVFGGLGDLLMPAITPQSTGGSVGSTGSAGGNTKVAPAVGGGMTAIKRPSIGGDLDSSLANLVGDLGIQKKDHQWNDKKLTGGSNWTPQVAPPSWGAPGPMMGGPAPGAPGAPGAMPLPMVAQPGFGMASAAGSGVPMMPPMMMGQPMMGQPMRPPLPGAAAPGAPLSPGPAAAQSKKPKDPLADLNLKDLM